MPPRKETPAALLSRTLIAAEDAIQPGFTTDGLLAELGLDSNFQDGRSLLDRLTDNRPTVRNRLQVGGMVRDVERLLDAVNEGRANSAQMRVAESLGVVITHHALREQELCQVGRAIVRQCERPDIIADEVVTFVDRMQPAPYQSRFMQNYLPS